MNTLPRAITAQIFSNTESYAALRRHWSVLMRSEHKRELAPLIGKDWRRSFTPITNRRKLENGAFVGWPLFQALMVLRSPCYEAWLLAPFAGLVTPTILQTVRGLVARRSAYACRSEDFTTGAFPFDAYDVPEAQLAPAAD
jgi:hypothetical protein